VNFTFVGIAVLVYSKCNYFLYSENDYPSFNLLPMLPMNIARLQLNSGKFAGKTNIVYCCRLIDIKEKRHLFIIRTEWRSSLANYLCQRGTEPPRWGILPLFGSYLWKNWLDLHENFTSDVFL